jgi:triose-phosphate isomerase
VVSAAFILTVETIGYTYQPLIDFRAYPDGSPIADFSGTADSDADREFVFIYEKDGERKEVRETDPLPDESEGWTFIDRVPVSGSANDTAEKNLDKGFRIWNEEGSEDVTDEVTGPEAGRQLFILMPDLSSVSTASSWRINSLYTWASRNGIDMLDIVSGSAEEINDWKDLSMAEYPIYTADDTSIKEVARGNPAVVYAENGKVVWKSTLRSLPIDDFLSPGTSDDPMSFRRDDHRTLMNLSLIFISVMAVLMVLSFLPRLQGVFSNSRYNKELKEPDEMETVENQVEQENRIKNERT